MTLNNKGILKAKFYLVLDRSYRIQEIWIEILPFLILGLSIFYCFNL